MKLLQWLGFGVLSGILTLWLSSCNPTPLPTITLNFGGAGVVRTAMETLEQVYQQEHPNVVLHSLFAGSQIIRQSLERKEPFDAVLLGDMPPLDELQNQGLIIPSTRQNFLTTDIGIIALATSSLQISSVQDLVSDRIKTIAIGSPGLAIGRYTQSVLDRLGITAEITKKAIIMNVDVREVLQAVESGVAEVGITFLSEAKASSRVKFLTFIPTEAHDPIRIGMATVTNSPQPQAVQQYFDFLMSDRAAKIFEEFGLHRLRS